MAFKKTVQSEASKEKVEQRIRNVDRAEDKVLFEGCDEKEGQERQVKEARDSMR